MDDIKEIQNIIAKLFQDKAIPEKTYKVMESFVQVYAENAKLAGYTDKDIFNIFYQYVERLRYLNEHPFHFEPYHQQILEPFNYFEFGLTFTRPMVNLEKSEYRTYEQLKEIESALEKGENVVLLANHQTEVDPQLINLLLEKDFPKLAQEMIFVAGDRVILDHLAVPVSMGRNLLCIYSKKHINNPPEQMEKKRDHNVRTMQRMAELLKEGGKCIYVAPSGGRDRPNEKGEFPVAELDPDSIELFYLMARKSKVTCHFHTLALLTHEILPPPNDVEIELGEERSTSYSGIYAFFGKAIDMELFAGKKILNKVEKRELRAKHVWSQINQHYAVLKKLKEQHESN